MLRDGSPTTSGSKAVRDALAAEMREVYPAAVAQLVDLFQRMAECDRECSRINGSAPYGEHRRLLDVELTARGVEGLLQPDVWIAEELRLPTFPARHRPDLCLAAADTAGFRTELCAAWSRSRLACRAKGTRRRAARGELARHRSLRIERAREREEREFKEGREAIAREIAERNRRNGWPC